MVTEGKGLDALVTTQVNIIKKTLGLLSGTHSFKQECRLCAVLRPGCNEAVVKAGALDSEGPSSGPALAAVTL